MNIRLNKIHHPVTTLGYGRRLGLWLQGCSIHCKGCTNQDTWAFDDSKQVPIQKVLRHCEQLTGMHMDGVTLSGGEPFDQPEALQSLLEGMHRWKSQLPHLDFLCYSGYSFPHLQTHHPSILELLDVLISEPYQAHLPPAALRGSCNQQVHLLTPLAQSRYPEVLRGTSPTLQVSVADGQAWFIGIPTPGSMQELTRRLQARGIELKGTSWRS